MLKVSRLHLALTLLALLAPAPLQAQTVEELSLDSLLSTPIRTAARYEQTAREVPASVTVVTAEEIEAAGHRTLAELLGGLRGFYVTDDHTREHLGTRGFGRILEHNNRILLLLNGVQLNESLYGAFDAGIGSGIDLSLVERVEVVRGPGSVLYGSGAMHAVVNVITKAPPATEGARAEVGLGSGGYGQASAWAAGSARGWRGVLSGRVVRADGRDLYFPEFDAAEASGDWTKGPNSSSTSSAFVHLQRGGWSAQANVSLFERGTSSANFGTPFNEAADHSARFVRAAVQHERAWGSRTEVIWRGSYIGGRTGIRYPVRDEAYGPDRPLIYDNRAHIESLGSEVLLRHDLRADNRLVVGAQLLANPGNGIGSRTERPDGAPVRVFADADLSFGLLSVYAQDEHQLRHDLSLTLGLRGDVYSHAGNALTPRAAVVYHPFEATTLKLLYGHAFRAPGGVETRHAGPLAYGTPLALAPNPGLRPERITTRELVCEQRLGPALTAVASAYDYAVTGLIDAVIDLERMEAQFQNRGRQEATGVEAGLEGRWGRALRGSVSYSYQRARQRSAPFVFNAPAHLLRSSGHVRLARFDVAAEARYDGARRTLRGDRLDGRWLVDAKVTAPPLLGARASVEVRNLLGATYFTPGNAYQPQDRLLQPGRTLLARLAVRL